MGKGPILPIIGRLEVERRQILLVAVDREMILRA